MRMPIVPSVLLACGLAATAGAADVVQIKDLSVKPMGNLGSADGAMTMHAKALLGGAWDSNVYASETDEKSDTLGRAAAGFELGYRLGEGLDLSLDVLGEGVAYSEESERNLMGGKATAGVDLQREDYTGALNLDYERYDDPLVQTGERIQRSTWGGDAAWTLLGAASAVSLTLDAHRTDYHEDIGGFVAEDRNVTNVRGGVRYLRQLSERGEWWVRAIGGTDTYDSNDRLQDATVLGGAAGARFELGERATVMVEAGAEARSYSREFGTGYGDKDEVTPILGATVTWPFDERGSEASLRVYSQGDNSLSSNAMQITGISLSGRYIATEQIALTAGLDGVNIADTAAAPGQDEEVRDTGMIRAGVEYAAMDGVVVRLSGKQTVSEAERATSNDYQRSEVALEVGIAY